MTAAGQTVLTIVADDFGMSPAYDRGILEAAAAGAIDVAGVMVRRSPGRIGELIATGIAVGIHLEGTGAEELIDESELLAQTAEFERLAGRPPDRLDGHHHCHARGAAKLVASFAAARGIAVRSVDSHHRRLLRKTGVRTTDLLVGRYEEDQPVVPAELISPPPSGVRSIEWMVHPGHPDPSAGSGYDRGRGEDLAALLRFELPAELVRPRRG